ncbi:MAG: multicopper oxidase family protein, partial [Actinomycetota bacterium]
MALPIDPEKDPLFRGLVLLLAVAVVVMMGFNALYRGRSVAPSAASADTAAAASATDQDSAGTVHRGGGHMTAEQMAASHEESMTAFPAKTAGRGGQVLEPTVENSVKVFELMAMPVEWEVAPGQVVTAWAYNGQVPGPEIRVERGDRVRVILTNHLTEPTTIHWHGVTVPNAMDGVPYVTQDPVMAGETFTYEFTVVDRPGTYLYHSHFNSTEQVNRGLYGAFVVEPARTAWDVEYTQILNDGLLGYTISGKGWPATTLLPAKLGQKVLLRLANVGQMLHPLHLHGYHFTVVARDGSPARKPYQADTLVVAPGETYEVLVRATEPGIWALHC